MDADRASAPSPPDGDPRGWAARVAAGVVDDAVDRRRLGALLLVALALASGPALWARSSPGATGPFTVLVVLTLCAAGAVAAAALHRCRGRDRAAWVLVALGLTLTAVVHAGAGRTSDLPDLTTAAARVGALALCGLGLASFPGVRRSVRHWGLVTLDGWLLGGSLFVVLWVLTLSPARLAEGELQLGAVWVLVDLALASVAIGLTGRVPAAHRAGALALCLASVLLCNGDLYRGLLTRSWGLMGAPAFIGSWSMALVLVAGVPWLLSTSPFRYARPDSPQTPAFRMSYLTVSLALAVVVVAAYHGRPVDPTLALVVGSLLAAQTVSLLLLARENSALYQRLAEQARAFRHRAGHDPLTGLPNRTEFTGRVTDALERQGPGRVAVLFVDLDGFKQVNDSLGHAVGDALLVEAAARLSQEVRDRDVVARFGGDEFVALLADCDDDDAVAVAERLRASLSSPYEIGHRQVVVSASIGLARPGAGDDAEATLRNADLALYRAKSGGRDRVVQFAPAMRAHAVRRVEGSAALRRALDRGELRLAYQPIVDLGTGVVDGVEALLRVDGIPGRPMTVLEAIETAEESGLIVPLGEWVLDRACHDLAGWLDLGWTGRVAVNISARQLENGDLGDVVMRTAARHGVTPDLLALEVTEHSLVRDLASSRLQLQALRARGVRVALDDFGTGFSSLSYVRTLPLDILKIDRAFVATCGGPRDLTATVLRLGRDLDLVVVAEGIERVDQLETLRDAGCRWGQGYLLAVPMRPEDVSVVLSVGRITLPVSEGGPLVSNAETRRGRT